MHFVVAEFIIDPTWVAYGYDAYVEVSLCFHWGVAWKLKWLMILRSAACYNAVWMSYNAWGPNQLPERERERDCVGCNQFYIVSGYFLEAFTTRVFCGILFAVCVIVCASVSIFIYIS